MSPLGAPRGWLKSDRPRGIDRYIYYFGNAAHPFTGRALESHGEEGERTGMDARPGTPALSGVTSV